MSEYEGTTTECTESGKGEKFIKSFLTTGSHENKKSPCLYGGASILRNVLRLELRLGWQYFFLFRFSKFTCTAQIHKDWSSNED